MLDHLFFPRAVAVIGASVKPLTIGNRIVKNLLDYRFTGPVYPVHPKANEVLGREAYPSITQVPGPVDLAHIVVRNTLVPRMLEECAEVGVKVAIVNTSGFREVGEEGAALEREMVEKARKLGIRVFGPNCQGVMNTDPRASLYANFTYARIRPGHMSIVCQGGGVAEVIDNYVCEENVGVRMYASNGNAADISIPEIIEYWGEDEGTRVILLHLESLSDPAAIIEATSRVSRKKPILGLKSGITREGARAVSSHTGGMMGQEMEVDLLFERCGILRFDDCQGLCEAAMAFSRQPAPRGKRVAILTNAGSPAICATDVGVTRGLELPDPTEETQARLREALFGTATVHNPVDMMATAGPKEFGAAARALLADPSFDALLTCFITPFFVDCEGVARELVAAAKETDRTVLVNLMTNDGWAGTRRILEEGGLPVYYFPESAARVMAAMARSTDLRALAAEALPELADVDSAEAAHRLAAAKPDAEGFLSAVDGYALLAAYGIASAEARWVSDPELAALAAEELGFPLVLKVDAPGVVHKTEAGGVVPGLTGADQVWTETARLMETFGPQARVQLQRQLPAGREVILGANRVPGVGAAVMFGLGGIHTEVLGDVVFKLAPISLGQARDMVRGIRAQALLDGVRGEGPVDKEALAGLLVRLARMVDDHPTIAEIDVNPVIVPEAPAPPLAVDVRIRVATV